MRRKYKGSRQNLQKFQVHAPRKKRVLRLTVCTPKRMQHAPHTRPSRAMRSAEQHCHAPPSRAQLQCKCIAMRQKMMGTPRSDQVVQLRRRCREQFLCGIRTKRLLQRCEMLCCGTLANRKICAHAQHHAPTVQMCRHAALGCKKWALLPTRITFFQKNHPCHFMHRRR